MLFPKEHLRQGLWLLNGLLAPSSNGHAGYSRKRLGKRSDDPVAPTKAEGRESDATAQSAITADLHPRGEIVMDLMACREVLTVGVGDTRQQRSHGGVDRCPLAEWCRRDGLSDHHTSLSVA